MSAPTWIGVKSLTDAAAQPHQNLDLIPRAVLFGNPVTVAPRISPDGTLLAYLAPDGGVMNVWVRTIGAEDDRPLTRDRDRGVRLYFWGFDNKTILYLQDAGGNENWRLYATSLHTGATRDLTPFDEVQAQVIERGRRFPDALLVALNKDNPQLHDAYRLDLTSGALTLIARNPGAVLGWLADADFAVRAAWAATPDGGFDLLVRHAADGAWQTAGAWGADDALTSAPLAFSRDGGALLLRDSRDANTGRLVALDLTSGAIHVIAEDPAYDVADALIHPDTREVQAAMVERERREWTVLDPSIEGDIAALRRVHDGDLHIESRDDADRTWIAAFTDDDGPVSYYAYDRARKAATFLFVNQPALDVYTLAAMEPIRYTARDGLAVHGYLTFPPGVERARLPLVLNVHGGPWERDRWGYQPEAQWLASRGYACLQVNYRGSTGYGKDFVNAGDKEWGGRMHDDLVDAVAWAVERGYADPTRVAVYGGSYGGYAALVGAAFTPDVFRCAIDIVGPSNLLTLIETIPPYWSALLATFHRRIGNPATEADLLRSRSPLFKADRIAIPLLIAQGANDPRVKQAESEQIVAALKEKGIAYEYLLFPDEGHGFAKPENRLRFYAAAERFLAMHLGGRYQEEESQTEE